ncbi:hypothetical protein B0H63DRAFT_473922 [Podospora didyma]|uniref:Uncharacterized protein n=1 Tax=Podospora didyma TaxID=330526 RepID=A0AAE0NQU1_9PEZI|nr:hypothetical protein B0H63DRAFT_473922 [Podospora didyma]
MTRNEEQRRAADTALVKWTPWLGISSILAIFACAASAAIIVGVSNDDVVEDWTIKPAVLLAILSAASNIAFSTALATGIAVRFWLYATRGTLLTQLHYIWDHGRGIGLIRALRAGSEARRVAIIATLGYLVQFTTGPLLQRSTFQIAQDRLSTSTMHLDLSTRIPDGWFGTIENGGVIGGRSRMSHFQDWYRNATIPAKNAAGYTCSSGTCVGSVRGAGFTHTCRSLPPTEMDLFNKSTDGRSVFSIGTKIFENSNGTPAINLTTLYIDKVEGKCRATLKSETCEIRNAIVSYPVIISETTVSLRYEELLVPQALPAVEVPPSKGDLLDAPTGTDAGQLAGLSNFIDAWLAENATKKINTNVNKTLYTGSGYLADIFFNFEPHPLTQCGLTWRSPTEYVLKAMHDFMFRVALRTGNGTETQTFEVQRTDMQLVFRSDGRYLGSAMATTACCLVLMGSLVWGWWRLDKKVTLSPLETARALGGAVNGSLVARRVRPDGTIDDILDAVKGVKFKVGEGYAGSGTATEVRVVGEEVEVGRKGGWEMESQGRSVQVAHHGLRGVGTGMSESALHHDLRVINAGRSESTLSETPWESSGGRS